MSGCPNAHPKGRNEVEHSERSGELCGRALVSQSSLRREHVDADIGFRESAVIDYRRGWNGASFIRCKREELCYSALTPQKKRTDL